LAELASRGCMIYSARQRV